MYSNLSCCTVLLFMCCWIFYFLGIITLWSEGLRLERIEIISVLWRALNHRKQIWIILVQATLLEPRVGYLVSLNFDSNLFLFSSFCFSFWLILFVYLSILSIGAKQFRTTVVAGWVSSSVEIQALFKEVWALGSLCLCHDSIGIRNDPPMSFWNWIHNQRSPWTSWIMQILFPFINLYRVLYQDICSL